MKPTRREFLRSSAASVAALALSTGTGLAARVLAAEGGPPDIAAVKGDKAAATRKAVELLGGMGRFVTRGAKVVVKPNIGFARTPDVGATTSPEVVAEVVKMCLEAGARKVLVLDFPTQKVATSLERSGILAACRDLPDTSVFGIDDSKFFADVAVPQGKELKKTRLARDVLECDVFINVPTAKSHGSAIVTLGMKNHMGIIEDRRPFHVFSDLQQCIADLATVARPHLIVVDASRILATGGPQGPGDLYHARTIVAGTRQATVDAHVVTLSTWQGKSYRPDQIGHIRAAAQHGLGEIDPAKMRVTWAAV